MKVSIRIHMMVTMLAGMLLPGFADCFAVQPYTPVHPDPVLEPWRWRSFPELKGLGLRCMAEDRDGNMWFGANDGVVRYGGLTWTTFTHDDGILGAGVNVLCHTKDGSLYAGTERGISRFSGGRWSRVFPPKGNLPWTIYALIEASDGSLWAATPVGALRLKHEGATVYTSSGNGATLQVLAPDVRLSIVPDEVIPAYNWPNSGIVLAGYGGSTGVIRSQSGTRIIWFLAPGGPGEIAGLKVGDRIEAVTGQPTVGKRALRGPVGTSLNLTVHREGNPETFEVTLTRERIEGTYSPFLVNDVFEDIEGMIWLGLYHGQILRFDVQGTEGDSIAGWRLYTDENGLDIGSGPHITQTRNGTIWTISDWGVGGVNRFNGKGWTHVRPKISVIGKSKG